MQFEAHGKVAVYGGVYLYRLHVYHFIIEIKLNHDVM
jgi:hypothetical protein